MQGEADVNKPMHDGKTPLYFAARQGHTNAKIALLNEGANANTPDKHGVTPYACGCLWGLCGRY